MYACFEPFHAAAAAVQVGAGGLLDSPGLERVRARRLVRLLETCMTRSPLYRGWLRGFDPRSACLRDLPVARRSVLMDQFDRWVTDPEIHLEDLRVLVRHPERIAAAYLERYVVWQSSGTSGEPGIFVQDARTMAVYDALEALRGPLMRWAQSRPAAEGVQHNLVLLGATGEHYASTVATERLRKLNPWFSWRLRELSFLQPMPGLRQALEALDPIVLASFPSVVLQLAEQRCHGRLHISPQEIWVGGETLTAATRGFIEHAFGCRVRNSYGSSEFLSIAFECEHGGLHLNADWVIMEPLDARGRPVGPDIEGSSVLLTNLANHVQPLLRYALPDRVTLLSRRCACGSALPLITVQGRDDDVLRLPGVDGATVTVSPLAITTVIEERGGLLNFQLRQISDRDLVLGFWGRETRGNPMWHPAAGEIARFLEHLGVVGVRVTCDAGDAPIRGAGGKVRRVVALKAHRRQSA